MARAYRVRHERESRAGKRAPVLSPLAGASRPIFRSSRWLDRRSRRQGRLRSNRGPRQFCRAQRGRMRGVGRGAAAKYEARSATYLLRRASRNTPLWPAGHLPRKGGDCSRHRRRRPSPTTSVRRRKQRQHRSCRSPPVWGRCRRSRQRGALSRRHLQSSTKALHVAPLWPAEKHTRAFVIPGRSRSEAEAKTMESMPEHRGNVRRRAKGAGSPACARPGCARPPHPASLRSATFSPRGEERAGADDGVSSPRRGEDGEGEARDG